MIGTYSGKKIQLDTASFRKLLQHSMICLSIYLIPSYVILIPIILFLLLKFYKSNQHSNLLLLGVYSLCCKSETVFYPFAVTLFFLIIFDQKSGIQFSFKSLVETRLYLFISFLVLTYIVQLFDDASIFSLPFFILTFGSPLVILFYILRTPITSKSMRTFFNDLIYLALGQILITLFFQAIPRGVGDILSNPTMGDFLTGTTNSSNLLGFLLCITILPFIIFAALKSKGQYDNLVFLISIVMLFLFMVHLSDAKARFYAFALSSVVVFVIKRIWRMKKLDIKLLIFATVIFIISIIFEDIIDYFTMLSFKYVDYISGRSNAKLEYYKRVISPNTRSFIEYVMGTGPGTNGSRAANALASDVLFKSEQSSVKLPEFISPKSKEFTKNHLAKLYTADYALATHERSAMLGNPFNSICAMFVEFGVIGSILFIRFINPLYTFIIRDNSVLSICSCILFFVVIILGIIDQSFETPMIMFFLYLFIGLSITLNQNQRNEKKLIHDKI